MNCEQILTAQLNALGEINNSIRELKETVELLNTRDIYKAGALATTAKSTKATALLLGVPSASLEDTDTSATPKEGEK